MSYKKASALILLAAALFTQSCKEDDLLPPANTNAYFTFINAAPFLGNDTKGTTVRALVETNGHTTADELKFYYHAIYPQSNTYLPFTEGDSKITFKDSTRTTLVTGTITTEAKNYYSAVLTGSEGNYSAVIVKDNFEPVPDKALVRIMHFSPDAGEISLYRDTEKQEVFGNLHYKLVTPYTPLTPGSNFSFILRRNDGTSKRVGRFFVPAILAGSAYTILLKGYVEPPDGDVAAKSSQIVFYRN